MHRKYVHHTKDIPRDAIRGGGLYDDDPKGRKCEVCQRWYKNPSSYSKHRCLGKETKSFTCNICMSTFKQNFTLKRHMMIHEKGSKEKTQHRKCLEESCNKNFYRVSSMYEHLEREHSWQCETELKTFNSISEFEKWKEEEDKNHYMNMYKRTSQKREDESEYYNFTCNFQRTERQWEQDDRIKGLWKSGVTPALQCPARMLCRISSEGTVEVRYLKTHNHVCDIKQLNHCHMHKSDLKEIKQKILQGVDIERIQSDCQMDFGECSQRDTLRVEKKNMLSRKQLRNIRRNLFRRRKSDLDSVNSKLFQLSKEKYNRVLVWKPGGEAAAIGKSYLDTENDIVAIGLQTKEQLEMLEEGGHRIVCIDATHSTNRYGYQLLHMVVPTQFRKGYPVASFVLSRIDKDVLISVFKMIRDKFKELGIDFKPKAVMTDDDQMTGPAFQEVFGHDVSHFLCHWHIKKSWDENKNKIKNEENRQIIRDLLHNMLEEPSMEKFQGMVQKFLDRFSTTEPTFIQYFKGYYVSRQKLWAQAYRDVFHAGTETNMFCESQFNKIKGYYMHRIPTRRIDDLLDLLIKMEKDAYIDHYKNNVLGVRPKIRDLLSDRHEESEKIPDDDVWKYKNLWFIQSQTTDNIAYRIEKLADRCKCSDTCFCCPGLCPHMFYCGCPYKFSICKHVHKLYTCLQNGTNLSEIVEEEGQTSEAQVSTSEMAMLVISDSAEPECLRKFPVVKNESLQPGGTYPEAGLSDSVNFTEPEGLMEFANMEKEVLAGDARVFPMNEKAKTIAPASKLEKQRTFKKNQKKKHQKSSKKFPLTNEAKLKAQRRKAKKLEKQLAAAKRIAGRAYQAKNDEVTSVDNGPENLTFPLLQKTSPTPILLEKDFGAALTNDRVPVLLNQYKIGDRFVDTLDLKGIVSELDKKEVKMLQRQDQNFLAGCLTDRVIDAYFHIILQGSKTVALTSRWYQDLENGQLTIPFAMKNYEKILVPSNPTERHWVLFVYAVQTKSWEFLNSIQYASLGGHYLNALQRLHQIFNPHGNLLYTNPKRIYQKDGDETGCGVYTCFYGKQCRDHEPYDVPLEVNLFRREIYNEIATYITRQK